MSFGAGPSLDEELDFEIDSTGDLDSVSGPAELNKDLTIQVIFTLQKFLGETPTSNVETRALSQAIEVIELDRRVDRVLQEQSSVSLSDDGRELTLSAAILTQDNDVIDFSFTVDE